MRKRIELGPNLVCDLDRLITTRLLVQANSGGGKSWALRRLLEQTHGHVQQLVLDPEGEFATLRERYDYVLAARQGGDTVADPRTAALLATRLLELEASAILDLYELKPQDRKAFVRVFLQAVIEAPRNLWHPVLILLDEAHVYCPQKDEAESSTAVIDAATRGRKRGFCLVLATQRLSKLEKDAAAELNNKLIGRTVLDDDMKRAGDELGFRTQEQRLGLRELGEGEFFAFGPALAQSGVIRGKTGPVLTRHPKAGERLRAPSPPPTAKIKALLPKLADLPAEAEHKAKTEAELRRDLAEARRTITTLQRQQPPAPKEKVVRREVRVIRAAEVVRLEKVCDRLERLFGPQAMTNFLARFGDVVSGFTDGYKGDAVGISVVVDKLRSAIAENRKDQAAPPPVPTARFAPDPSHRVYVGLGRQQGKTEAARLARAAPNGGSGDGRIPKAGARRMLEALARRHPVDTTWRQAAQLAGLAQSGTFDGYKSDLRRGGYVLEERGFVVLTERGWELIGKQPGAVSAQTTEEVLELYAGILKAGARRMVDVLMTVYPDAVTREELAQQAGIAQSGTFDGYLSDIYRAGLAEKRPDKSIMASELLMNPAGAAP